MIPSTSNSPHPSSNIFFLQPLLVLGSESFSTHCPTCSTSRPEQLAGSKFTEALGTPPLYCPYLHPPTPPQCHNAVACLHQTTSLQMSVIPTIGRRWALHTEDWRYLANGAQTLLHPVEPRDAVLPHTDALSTCAQTGSSCDLLQMLRSLICSPLGQSTAIKTSPDSKLPPPFQVPWGQQGTGRERGFKMDEQPSDTYASNSLQSRIGRQGKRQEPGSCQREVVWRPGLLVE